MHDLATVDMIRERLDVSYQAAMDALDDAEGDVVRALALLESSTAGGLHAFEDKVKEGVKRGLAGDELDVVRWKLMGQEVGEWYLGLAGFAAVAVVVLGILITSSTVETEFAGSGSASGDGSSAS